MLPDLANIGEIFRGGADEARRIFEHQMERLVYRLDQIQESLEGMHSADEEGFYLTAAGVTDATGSVNIEIAPRLGYAWKVERITAVVPGGATSIGVVYVDSIAPMNARHILTDADFYAQDVGIPIRVQANSRVIFAVTGAPVGANVAIGMQVAHARYGDSE